MSRAAASAAARTASATSEANASSNSVSFCVNPVLFENCGLLLDAPSGLTTASIMKLRQESSNLTSISLANWRELSSSILGLPEKTAYSIFDVFFALSGGCMQASPSYYASYPDAAQKPVAEFRQEGNRNLLHKMGGTVDESRWPLVSTSRQVSLPGLIIFLLAQLLLERPPRCSLGSIAQEAVVSHVRQYLHDYLTAVSVTRQGRLTYVDVLELRYLLREFVGGVEQPFGTGIAFLWPRNEKTVDIAVLAQFIRPRVVTADDVTKTLKDKKDGASFPNNIVVRGLRDTMYIPASPILNLDLMTQLLSSNFTVTDCAQTSLYVASPLPHTRLSNLRNCTIALGPISGILAVDNCEQCTISALCGSLVVSNCANVRIFVCTNTPPVILNGTVPGSPSNVNLLLAPYNSHYSTLEEHLLLTGINPKLNFWNVGLPSQAYVLPPDEFAPICFPVAPQGNALITTRANPCTVPQPYADALQNRMRRFQDISRDLQEAYTRLEEEGRADLAGNLRTQVQNMFVEWLHKNGQANGLLDLLHQPAAGK